MSQTKIVYILCPHPNTGGHFINWTLSFLTNQSTVWNRNAQEEIFNTGADTLEQHFHHHSCFVTLGFDSMLEQTRLIKENFKGPVAFLFVCLGNFDNIQPSASINEYTRNDYIQAINWIQDNKLPFVFFDYDPLDYLNIFYNNRFPIDMYGKPQADYNTVISQYEDTFFKTAKEQFSSEHIWDRRERLALIIKPFYNKKIHSYKDVVAPLNYYTTTDLWNAFPELLPSISKVADINIDVTKLDQWTSVYNVWKTKHKQQFSRDFDLIINAIVTNINLDLTPYHMNFFNEVLIQHALIVRHNLNFKTWQLEKFPNNTQDLHLLLEPNIHHI